MQPSPSQVQSELYVAVVAALVTKWPTNDKHDHKKIAETADSITKSAMKVYVGADPSSED